MQNDHPEKEYPKVRCLQAIPIKSQINSSVLFSKASSETKVLLRDPEGFSNSQLEVTAETFFVISQMDGLHSLRDIQAELMRKMGYLIYIDKIEQLVNQLDECYFLENQRFIQHRQKIFEQYRQLTTREARLAGQAYPAKPEALKLNIQAYFESENGPGSLLPEHEYHPQQNEPSEKKSPFISSAADYAQEKEVVGLIAPHIDYQRGGVTYAWAYHELARCCSADVFIILGTLHADRFNNSQDAPLFIATKKNFATPLGELNVETELLEALEAELGEDFLAEEFLHQNEHSVELQTVFLAYLREKYQHQFTIVPLLCAFPQDDQTPKENPIWEKSAVDKSIQALKKIISDYPKKICLIASVDLSHVGPMFSGSFSTSRAASLNYAQPVTEHQRKSLQRLDRELLDMISHPLKDNGLRCNRSFSNNAENFINEVLSDDNPRNICGFVPIYTLLKVISANSANLLSYAQWPDPNGMVSFAAMAFYR